MQKGGERKKKKLNGVRGIQQVKIVQICMSYTPHVQTLLTSNFTSTLSLHESRNRQRPDRSVFNLCASVSCSYFCAGEDGDIVSVTLPPSQYSRTVVVTRGLHTPNHVRVTENPPTGPPALIYMSRLSVGPGTDVGNTSSISYIASSNDNPLT
jgi:hypothetical protein